MPYPQPTPISSRACGAEMLSAITPAFSRRCYWESLRSSRSMSARLSPSGSRPPSSRPCSASCFGALAPIAPTSSRSVRAAAARTFGGQESSTTKASSAVSAFSHGTIGSVRFRCYLFGYGGELG